MGPTTSAPRARSLAASASAASPAAMSQVCDARARSPPHAKCGTVTMNTARESGFVIFCEKKNKCAQFLK
jgi:hypothetical protein